MKRRWDAATDHRVFTYAICLVALWVIVHNQLTTSKPLDYKLLGALVTMLSLALGNIRTGPKGRSGERSSTPRRTPGQLVDKAVERARGALESDPDRGVDDGEGGDGEVAEHSPIRAHRPGWVPRGGRLRWAY